MAYPRLLYHLLSRSRRRTSYPGDLYESPRDLEGEFSRRPPVPGGVLAGVVGKPPGQPMRLTARAMTSARITNPPKDSSDMRSFARAVRGMVSVGLKAIELDSEK